MRRDVLSFIDQLMAEAKLRRELASVKRTAGEWYEEALKWKVRAEELEKENALLSSVKWSNLRFKRGQKQFLDWIDSHPRVKDGTIRLMRFVEFLQRLRDKYIF
jgi:hypothetical protein